MSKKMNAMSFNTLREAVAAVNAQNIAREDIVSVLYVESQYQVIYFKD